MGPGDKSLANLPVTQLLAVVKREPRRPRRPPRGERLKAGAEGAFLVQFWAGHKPRPRKAVPLWKLRVDFPSTGESGLLSARPGIRAQKSMCRQKAGPESWDRTTNHCCSGKGVVFLGDWELLGYLNFGLSLSLLPILALAQWLGAILEVFQKLRGAVWVDAVNCPNSLNETICCSRRQSWQLNPIIKISLLYPQPHAGPPRPTP